jgi:hypothetical protein
LGRERVKVNERRCIALDFPQIILSDIVAKLGYGQRTGAMTRFTIHQRHFCLRPNLLAMHTPPEILGNRIMPVTLRHTIVSTNILGVKTANDHPLVFPHRQNLIIFSYIGASRQYPA